MRINLAPLTAIFQPLAMKVAGGVCVALALFAGVQTVRLASARHDIAIMRLDREVAIRNGIEIALKANEAAAARRTANEARNRAAHDNRMEAIDNAGNDQTDAPGRALACERLRQSGQPTPASCR